MWSARTAAGTVSVPSEVVTTLLIAAPAAEAIMASSFRSYWKEGLLRFGRVKTMWRTGTLLKDPCVKILREDDRPFCRTRGTAPPTLAGEGDEE